MASFKLHDSNITATVSASAKVTANTNTNATVTVTATGSIPSGYYVYSTGVVVDIIINGKSSGNKTLFGNASGYYYGKNGAKSTTYSVTVDKGTSAKNITWSVAFKNAIDGTIIDTKHTATGSVSIGARTAYTVSYNANGGSGAPGPQTKWHGMTLTISSVIPTRSGYSFNNWALSKAEADNGRWYYTPGSSCGQNNNLTLYAVWTPNKYPVRYDANGGASAPSPQEKVHDQTLKLSTYVPTRANYIFRGWATTPSATTANYSSGGNYTTNAAVTLYAVWELAYVKPRITNLFVSRCDSDGNLTDTGTHVRVKFNYECDRTLDGTVVEWKSESGGSGLLEDVHTAVSSTSGSLDRVIEDSVFRFSTDSTYTFNITVTDSHGSTTEVATLPGAKFIIDILAQGKGAALNKPAELEDVFDIGFETYLRGGLRYGVLGDGANLNSQLTPGFYVGSHTYTYENYPIDPGDSFTLEVMSGGNVGQLIQRLTVCKMDRHIVFERSYYESYWGEWMKTSPTVIYEEMFYTPSAADTFELVGSITIPKRTAFTITARGMWQNARCHGIIISDRQTSDNGNHPYSYSLAACFNEDDRVFFPSCTYSGDTGVEARTYYIWGKWAVTNLNKAEVTGYYMPY